MLTLKPGRFLIKIFPPIILAVLILFFSGCWPRFQAGFEYPLTGLGAWFNRQFYEIFPSNSLATSCSDATLADLAIERALFEQTKVENENLRQQLGFFERQSLLQIPARIVKRSASPVDSTFVIDRGLDDGLSNGAAVIAADGHFIGKIIETRSQSAIVQSVLGRESQVAVSFLNSSRTIGLATGNGGALLNLNFIPQDEKIAINDLVVTSGLEAAIPPGLVVGLVTDVEKDLATPFQSATVEPLIDFRQYNTVAVIVLGSNL